MPTAVGPQGFALTTTVVSPTRVVKVDVGDARSQMPAMGAVENVISPDTIDKILERVRQVVKVQRIFTSERRWCTAAGLSPTYIAALRGRGGAGGTGEVKDVKHDSIAALARAAGKNVAWLMGDSDTETSIGGHLSVELALQRFDWPDISAAGAQEVQRRARAEAAAAGPEDLPVKFWAVRLQKIVDDVRGDEAGSHERPARRRSPHAR